MREAAGKPGPSGREYVSNGIRSEARGPAAGGAWKPGVGEAAGRAADEGVDHDFIETGILIPDPKPAERPVAERVGVAILRLRIYRGLSQAKLEQLCGVDQTTISRFENANGHGLSSRRLFAMLRALRAEEISFGPGPRTVPQSSWEDAMYGDLWERAGRLAEARVNRRRSA
jgi:transcriptional regulator with XRE-family HTH domain